MSKKEIEVDGPGRGLFLSVRLGIMRHGYRSIAAWCRQDQWCKARGLDGQFAYNALHGMSNTPDAEALRERIIKAAGLQAAA